MKFSKFSLCSAFLVSCCLLHLSCFFASPVQGERLRLSLERRKRNNNNSNSSSSSSTSNSQVLGPIEEGPLVGSATSSSITDAPAAVDESSSSSSSNGSSSNGSNSNGSNSEILELASSLSEHQYDASGSASAPELLEEPSELTELIMRSRECHRSANAILVIDGGSTGTRGALFRAMAESCPLKGRRMLAEGLQFLGEGRKRKGLRQLLEEWMDANAGPDWPSKPYDAKALLKQYPSMLEAARSLMFEVLDDAAGMIDKNFSDVEKEEARSLGVPVLFFSTAGVRDTHDWFRRGLFAGFQTAINAYSSASHGYSFFTNEDWTRPISGVEEGLLAFVASNQLLGRFSAAKALQTAIDEAGDNAEARKRAEKDLRQSLVSIVEVGGASMQIVFPVFTLGSSPSFVRTTNLVREGYLSADFPDIDVMSTSFMQLGASSATGIFYKSFCSNSKNRRRGVCLNPCLPRGFKQACSTGAVDIAAEGSVTVGTTINQQRVKPVAYYCTSSNDEIAKKTLNRLSCLAAGINPEEPLEARLTIPDCHEMQGTGDFDACNAAVYQALIDPAFPLPANQEASYTGFDTVGQIFEFISTDAPVVITGKALVVPVEELIKVGLLARSFAGDPEELADAARLYCAAPVVAGEAGAGAGADSGLFRDLSGSVQTAQSSAGTATSGPPPVQRLKLNNYNLENCLKLAFSHGLLTLLNKRRKVGPSSISFQLEIKDPETDLKVGEYGWPPGAILRAVLDRDVWAKLAYELGKHHSIKERYLASQQQQPQEQEGEGEVARRKTD
ncbi:hypothetical protein Esti_005269 [Eimeria stiedai]